MNKITKNKYMRCKKDMFNHLRGIIKGKQMWWFWEKIIKDLNLGPGIMDENGMGGYAGYTEEHN